MHCFCSDIRTTIRDSSNESDNILIQKLRMPRKCLLILSLLGKTRNSIHVGMVRLAEPFRPASGRA